MGLGPGCNLRTRARRPGAPGTASYAVWVYCAWLSIVLGCAVAGGVGDPFETRTPDPAPDLEEGRRLVKRARQQAWAEDLKGAAILFERALLIYESTLGPNDPILARPLSDLGLAYRATGDFERAEPLLGRALVMYEAMNPPDRQGTADALTSLGILYRSTGEYERAQPLLERALGLRQATLPREDSKVAGAMNNLGVLHYAIGNYAEAEPLLTQALAIREKELEVKASAFGRGHPHVELGLVRLGRLYARMGKYERAEPLLMRALEVDPDSTEIYGVIISEYEREGRFEEAIEAYESWLRVEPDRPGVKNNLAWLLASGDPPSPWDLDRALELAQAAREELPQHPGVADTLGWVMLKADQSDAAIFHFYEAIDGHPVGSPERAGARYRLALAYERAGDPRSSIQELERALAECASFPERLVAQNLLTWLRSGRASGELSSAAGSRVVP